MPKEKAVEFNPIEQGFNVAFQKLEDLKVQITAGFEKLTELIISEKLKA